VEPYIPYDLIDKILEFDLSDLELEFIRDELSSNPLLIRAFYNNLTPQLVNHIETIIRREGNIIISIFGEPNSGKSIIGLTLAVLYYIIKQKITGIEPEILIAKSKAEAKKMIISANYHALVMEDEQPKHRGDGSVILEDNLNNLYKICRATQISYIKITPEFYIPKIVNVFLRAFGINKFLKLNRAIVYNVKTQNPIGYIITEMIDENSRLFKEYHKDKHKNVKEVKERGGSHYTGYDMPEIEVKAQKVIARAERDGKTLAELTQREIYYYIHKAKVASSQKENIMILTEVYNYVQKAKKEAD
jgi:hypothetical protein